MRFYLSSYHLGQNADQLVQLFTRGKKIGIIPNALDFATDHEQLQNAIKTEFDELRNIELKPELLDLRDYFHKPSAKLKTKLDTFNGVWVIGGNTFILRKAMQYSGFDQLIKSKPDIFVYAGYSAGVCILAPSLKGLETVDTPDTIPAGYAKQVIWDGLGLIDFYIAPHYQSDHPETDAVNDLIAYYINHKLPYKTLRDGEDMVI